MTKQASLSIQFLGAAGTVTGSKFLITAMGKRILVDCGLFQGLKELRLRNWQALPVNAARIDVVLLTHGHLDHVGYLPLLVKQGFTGEIMATQPTVEITKLILADSARINEEDADRANARHYSKHKPALPLYNLAEAEEVFPLLHARPVDEWQELFPGISFRFRSNGHILGATFIELRVGEKTIVFSGDIGREEDPLLPPPQKPSHADILVMESTYGNRLHPENSKQLLADAINKAAMHGGTILIPGFAVERIQLLMYYLWQLQLEKKIPALPVYMDSPMGARVLDIFCNNQDWHKLSSDVYDQMCKAVKIVQTPQDTMRIASKKSPKIIIAGSGMVSGGRMLSYFEHYLNDPKTTILFVGYQAEGTRGRALLNGAKEIKMRGKFWRVNAAIDNVEGLSAHADQAELIGWVSDLKPRPEKTFIVHGETDSSNALKSKLEQVGHLCEIPPHGIEYSFSL